MKFNIHQNQLKGGALSKITKSVAKKCFQVIRVRQETRRCCAWPPGMTSEAPVVRIWALLNESRKMKKKENQGDRTKQAV